MEVIFREIDTRQEIEEFCSLQQELFDIQKEECFPSHYFNMICRKEPEMGFLIGAFAVEGNTQYLIGGIICITVKEDKSLYAIAMGLVKKYRSSIYGPRFISAIREITLSKGYTSIYILCF